MLPELVERIDVRLLANLSYNFRSPNEAILELVDNGLASRRETAPVMVTVTGSGRVGGTLTVVTRGGRGMGLSDLEDFLHWGKEPDAIGLHRFGQGGKAAIGYLGTGVRITANRFDQADGYRIEDRDWLARPNGRPKCFVPALVRPAVPGVGVVQLEIVGIKKRVNLKRLEKELAWRYRPAMLDGHLKLKIGRSWIRPSELPAGPRHEFEHPLLVPDPHEPSRRIPVMLRGWVGIAPPKFEDRGGVRCSQHGRVVEQNEYFGHKTSSFKASMNSLIGEVDLSFVDVSLNKNAFDTGSPQWEAASEVMYDVLQPYVDQLLRRRDNNEPSEEERYRAMEAKDIAHGALEQLAQEAERPGSGGQLAGRKPPERRVEREDKVVVDSIAEQVERQPRTSPPLGAVGHLRRKGASLDWDVRSLDPKIRSATEAIGPRSEVVINNQFPAYRQRGGDLLYMIETGLLEELKPAGNEDDKTVGEYSDQVTDALYLAINRVTSSKRSPLRT